MWSMAVMWSLEFLPYFKNSTITMTSTYFKPDQFFKKFSPFYFDEIMTIKEASWFFGVIMVMKKILEKKIKHGLVMFRHGSRIPMQSKIQYRYEEKFSKKLSILMVLQIYFSSVLVLFQISRNVTYIPFLLFSAKKPRL